MDARRVDRYMTPSPQSIGQEQSLAEGSRRMRVHGIRHLPVLHGGTLVGVLSERDIALVEALGNVDPEQVTVEDAMTSEPYTVGPDEPIGSVVKAMAEHKYGCAVVVDGTAVVGLLTTTDALRLLWDQLESERDVTDGLAPSEVRTRISDDHRRIRGMLHVVEDLACSIKAGNTLKATALRVEARKLYHSLCAHTDLEDRILAPALGDTPGFGDVRREQLLNHHEEQRSQWKTTLERMEKSNLGPNELAEAALSLVTDLRLDMAHEDKDLLNENLLKDDPIQVDFGG